MGGLPKKKLMKEMFGSATAAELSAIIGAFTFHRSNRAGKCWGG